MRRLVPLAAFLVALAPAGARAWQTAVAGTPQPSRPLAVVLDGAGDVLAAGRGGDDGIVAKLDGAAGGPLWQQTIAGSAAAVDQLRAVTRDASDAVVVAGRTTNTGTAGDAVVAKYTSAGALAWRVDADGGAGGEDDALAVTVDGSGDVLVAGQTTLANETLTRFSVTKRAAADGASAWRTDLTGSPGTGRAVLAAGSDVYAAGGVAGAIVVAKLAGATGAQAWRTNVAGSPVAADIGRAIALGGGRVVVAGRMVTEAGGTDFAVVALDAASGAEAWRYVADGSATGALDKDDAFGVAVDAAGDVVAVGVLSGATSDDDIAIVKLAGATGAELWRTTVNGGNDNDDDAAAVALDAAGDVFVVGGIRYASRGRDLFLAKVAGATGAEKWRREVDGPQGAADFGAALALDATGNPVVAGRLRNGPAGDEFVVLKRTGANGGDFPCGDGNLDAGEACDDGNVTPGDGCRADCTVEVCGDGITDPQETCDDGNTAAGDCCSAACQKEADGAPCDDADACTLADACVDGRCTPADTVHCTASDPCDAATCDPATGACSVAPKANGAPCDDQNACTVLERCIDRVCTGGFTPPCDDADPCTLDHCDATRGCVADPLTGFDGVRCVFARDGIRPVCTGLPGPLDAALGRTRRLLDRGADADRPRRARRALNGAIAAMKRGTRVAAKQLKRNRITAECADALAQTLGELLTRATGLRDTLKQAP